MEESDRAIAVVGIGAILPDAPSSHVFWENVKAGRYSITDVPANRWDPTLYYDPDPKTPDKTYSKIGGWVRDWEWNPLGWGLPVPPRVSDAMDDGQKWAVSCTRQVLLDFGYPQRALDLERTAVILGNAMAGEKHYLTALRVYYPEYTEELAKAPSFTALPSAVREAIRHELKGGVATRFPEITEDTMPGELSNCIAGRIANLFNLRGPNYVVDAACASAIAAISAAIEGLTERDYDAAITGGIDRNMGASAFIKFCKIGALSATGTRPYADGADGFVMGEGAALFLLKRLDDAERAGDKIYAVIRGVGGASDGKGKGITAPNPAGQRLAIERAWKNAGLSPATATMVEGHGTSTKVGDVVEVDGLSSVFLAAGARPGTVALGSVKSNIGHLKAAAGAAGLLKAVLALHEKVLPPSLHFDRPNPNIDFARSPFFVNTHLQAWQVPADQVRRAGLSAFGFGGTNFHIVLEEHVPGRLRPRTSLTAPTRSATAVAKPPAANVKRKSPLRGALVLGAADTAALKARLQDVQQAAARGQAPNVAPPREADLSAQERIAIDYGDAKDLADKAAKALKAMSSDTAGVWKALRAQGIFRGRGPAPKLAFLYTGQGSQYVNMLAELRQREPVVADTFAAADQVMTPLLDKPLSQFLFVDPADAVRLTRAEEDLRQTAITQPAVLAVDIALTRLLAEYGIRPDMVMGHSLGEYAALVAAGALPFEDALEAVSARGREMTRLSVEDNGMMAAVFAPLAEIERILAGVPGYVVIANVNSNSQAVVGGATVAVRAAIAQLTQAGFNAVALPVSHAFHTRIVAPASEPLRRTLERLHLTPPTLPIVANVTGKMYPMGPTVVPEMLDLLAQQVASPVQFVKGLHTLHAAGVRLFVEVGPKKALQGFVDDVFQTDSEVVSLFTNHPKLADSVAFNQALCGFYAAGLGSGMAEAPSADLPPPATGPQAQPPPTPALSSLTPHPGDRYRELGQLFAEFLERGHDIYFGRGDARTQDAVVITGASLGLPGAAKVFDDANLARILNGEQFIDVIPTRFRQAMVDKHITRLVKSEVGGPTFETIESVTDVIKLAGRRGAFDLHDEFGVALERIEALDITSQLAIAAGIDALRDAGIPLVMHYKTTTRGTQLADRWMLPQELRDETGVIFASAFPGYDRLIGELNRAHADHACRQQIVLLEALRDRLVESGDGPGVVLSEIDHRLHDLRAAAERDPYRFDRRFLFRILSMGHSQLAELIGARGPNTQINSACASSTQAVALAEDWIRTGRCRRVIVIAADDVTGDNLLEWIGAGFLASGAAATDEVVSDAALPFDRRRHGMIMGMGAAAMVVESADAVRERGIRPICEVLASATANSAFHGTRLDVEHICQVMERLVADAERRHGVSRQQIAPRTVFVSHETYTPARGGSAAAEVQALRDVFGTAADSIVVTNTKGFTGHAMAVGIEDVVAIKALETGLVPPVANFKEVDPELGPLHLSKGGAYEVDYALRLGAGFGSQISMTLMRRVPGPDGRRPNPDALGYQSRIGDPAAWTSWLSRISGQANVTLEVAHRTLRVRDPGSALPEAAAPAATPQTGLLPAPAPTEPTPATATEPVLATSAAPTPSPASAIESHVLALVAETTGYPSDMLDLDLDLEADLGVDTVKQAEVFRAVREAYGIARDDKLRLRDFPTLRHVLRFVEERRPDLAAADAAATATPAPAATPPSSSEDPIQQRVLALFAEKTGYPPEMLDVDLDLEADLGIDTVKQAEMFAAIRQAYDIPRDDKLKLRDFPTLRHVIQFVHDRRPDLVPAAAVSAPASSSPGGQSDSAAGRDNVAERVLALFAEKTGYPPEMLDVDLDLEADLGIDTVKQAEMFAAIRQAYDIPRDDKLKLRDFPTLRHVIQFVHDRRPSEDTAGTAAPAATSGAVAGPPPTAASGAETQVRRRVPAPILRPPLSACKKTGVALGAGTRVLIMADQGGVARALQRRLKKLSVEALIIDDAPADDDLVARVNEWANAGRVTGVYWLSALDDEPALAEMKENDWRELLRVRVKLLYRTMRALYESVAPAGSFLITATRLGGQHGYDDAGAFAPLGGAVTGFTKAYKRERGAALVKCIDFEPKRKAVEIADLLVAESLRDPGAVEIGYTGDLRWSVGLLDQASADGQPGMTLGKDSVFVVTGAAGGIVSAIVADLAAASGATFYLLDKVPPPDKNDPDLQRFAKDREGLKRELFERMKARGERATPASIEQQLAALERTQAALAAIQAVESAGGTAHYRSVDLTDGHAVGEVIAEIRERHGLVDVLLHAAGLEISRLLPDKEPREFALVFDVKADGLFHLLHAIGGMPLGAMVGFSSIAGRFGNGGQCDYSAANDLLCKVVSHLRRVRPRTRALAIDWTAWGGIGMASRGSIPKMMEMAGIDMLPPDAGIPVVRHELTTGSRRGEIVIAERLGILTAEWDISGGFDPAAAELARGPMIGQLTKTGLYSGWVMETRLDPTQQPFLSDHRIDGTAILPGVMGLEGFAEAVNALVPGWYVAALEGIDFLAPFKFYRDEPRTLVFELTPYGEGSDIVAHCALVGTRPLPGQTDPQRTIHFTARVRLQRQPPGLPAAAKPAPPTGPVIGKADVYRIYFHGPAYQVVDCAWNNGNAIVGLLASDLPADHRPESGRLLTSPRLIELCFQTAGLWEIAYSGRMGLPSHIDSVRLGQVAELEGPLAAIVTPTDDAGFDAAVVDGSGKVGVRLVGYRTAGLPAPLPEEAVASLRAIVR